MSHIITETAAKYEENLTFNINAAKTRRTEILEYIKQTEEEVSKTDGRKKSVIECLSKRIVSARTNLQQIEDKIKALESLSFYTEELADIDDQVAQLCKKRNELLNNDMLMHSYLRVKAHGFI
jgi:cation transport regulator ChaC